MWQLCMTKTHKGNVTENKRENKHRTDEHTEKINRADRQTSKQSNNEEDIPDRALRAP